MGALSWVVLLAVGLVFANEHEDKDMEPVVWDGGETLYPDTGEKHFNGLATRAQIHENFAFLAIPKLKPGVISTCCKLDMTKEIDGSSKQLLTPFPPNQVHDPNSCDGLQSVVDLFLDHMNIIWCLDAGRIIHSKDGKTRPHICPPKVVGYDIHTGKVVHQVVLINHVSSKSRLQFVFCNYDESGLPYVYVTDAGTKSFIVWDTTKNDLFRAELPEAVIDEHSPKDVLYAVLIRKSTGENKVYFTYRSSDSLWCINTEHLQRDKSTAKAWEIGKKPSQLILLGTDDWSSIYCRNVDKMEVYKWNTDTDFVEKNFQLVHTSDSNLTPTHAIADYKNGVMRIIESNLVEYLKHDCPPKKSHNCLSVMAVSEPQSPPESVGEL